jgi:hypothetical protein
MTRRFAAILLATLAAAAAPTPALAGGGGGDIAATRSYLQADYALARTMNSYIEFGQKAIRNLTSTVTRQCPNAVAGSPEDHDSELLSEEVVGALTVAGYHEAAPVIVTFARAVHGLRWSNPALTRKVQTSATRLRGVSSLPAPDLCADVRAWAASGFQTLSAGTTGFDRSYLAVNFEAEEVPWRLLAPFDHSEALTVQRIKQAEARLANVEAEDVKYYSRILDALGLQP